MTDELRQLLIQVRDRIEAEELMMDAGPEADFAEKVWDGINGLVGCDPECGCELHDQEPHTDGKLLLFPAR